MKPEGSLTEQMLYHFSFTIQVYGKPAEPDCIDDIAVWLGTPDEYPALNGVTITRSWVKLEYSRGGTTKITYESPFQNRESSADFIVTSDIYWVIKNRNPTYSEKIAADHQIENYIKGYLVGMHGEKAREAFGFAI